MGKMACPPLFSPYPLKVALQVTSLHRVLDFLALSSYAPLLYSATGEGYARFDSEEDFEKALTKDKERMGQRYIEVFACPQSDMEKAQMLARGVPTTTTTALSEDDLHCAAVIRMRGLPFRATEADIVAFFEQAGVQVLDGGVLVCKGADGRVTGEGYVQFGSEEDARRALQRHRDQMGSRYIELFRSSKPELLNVLRRQQTTRDLQQQVRDGYGQGYGHGHGYGHDDHGGPGHGHGHGQGHGT
jgi:hypothetical protein